MKLSNFQLFSLLLASITLAACGGSSGSDSADDNKQTDTTVKSADLVADEDFSFRVDQEITVTIEPADGVTGVAHIYSATDATSPADNQRPDYLSRVTTVRPDRNANATFNYTGTEGILWIEWLPTEASAQEGLQKITIAANQSTYTVDVQ